MRQVVDTVLDVDECQYGLLGSIFGQFGQCRRRRYMPHNPLFVQDGQDLYSYFQQNQGPWYNNFMLFLFDKLFNYEFFDLEPRDYIPYYCNFLK